VSWLQRMRSRRGPLLVYIGLATCAIGFALIAVSWGEVAGKLNVAVQIPYVVSAGFTGIGLIVVGAMIVNIAVRQIETGKREAQTAQMVAAMQDLQTVIENKL
jgi:hypothetical protein